MYVSCNLKEILDLFNLIRSGLTHELTCPLIFFRLGMFNRFTAYVGKTHRNRLDQVAFRVPFDLADSKTLKHCLGGQSWRIWGQEYMTIYDQIFMVCMVKTKIYGKAVIPSFHLIFNRKKCSLFRVLWSWQVPNSSCECPGKNAIEIFQVELQTLWTREIFVRDIFEANEVCKARKFMTEKFMAKLWSAEPWSMRWKSKGLRWETKHHPTKRHLRFCQIFCPFLRQVIPRIPEDERPDVKLSSIPCFTMPISRADDCAATLRHFLEETVLKSAGIFLEKLFTNWKRQEKPHVFDMFLK